MKVNKFVSIEIGREKGASVIFNKGIDDAVIEKLLIEALPFGNPVDEFYKFVKIGKSIYLSVLHILPDKDYGIALVVELNKELAKKNPIGFVDGLYNTLVKSIKDNGKSLPDELDVEYKEYKPTFEEYKDFDSVIFALLTSQKTVIIGDKAELKSFMGGIFECIPPELRGFMSFAANMENIHNEEIISLVPISERILKALDSRKEEYTVLLLPLKTAYGIYSSQSCKRIAKLYKEKKIESIKEEISHIFTLAIQSNKMETIADYAAQHDLSIADASLIMWIRAEHFNLQMEKSILEELGN